MTPEFILHVQHNWPLAVVPAGLLVYISIVLVSGVFLTNQGKIVRSNDPASYWRWVARLLGLSLVCLVVLLGSYFLSKH